MRGCHISVNSMYLFTLYHNLFIFVLVFCLCFVHLSFLLRRSHRCTMLINFWNGLYETRLFRRCWRYGRLDSSYLGDRSKVWLVGHIRYAFWGVTLLVVVNLFVTKKIVVVKKVGFMYGVF